MNLKNKIIKAESLKALALKLRKKGLKIVFTNGCFDILHAGHIKTFVRAKALGDVLIVGLNSDSSVKKLKGHFRPINNFSDRAFILASLALVDYVVGFSASTPYELIKKLRPDILLKGGDYRKDEIAGAEFAGKVELVPLLKGRSTSKIIEKMAGK